MTARKTRKPAAKVKPERMLAVVCGGRIQEVAFREHRDRLQKRAADGYWDLTKIVPGKLIPVLVTPLARRKEKHHG